MLELKDLYVNRQRLGKLRRTHIVEGPVVELSWSAVSSSKWDRQTSYRCKIVQNGKVLFDSGTVISDIQHTVVSLEKAVAGCRIEWYLEITGTAGDRPAAGMQFFYIGNIEWTADWITKKNAEQGSAICFRKEIVTDGHVSSACLYMCGIGYCHVEINGKPLDDALLDPPQTDYLKQCQYIVYPEIQDVLSNSVNCISIEVANGWRSNEKVNDHQIKPNVRFFGILELSAILELNYSDGRTVRVCTDESWDAGHSAITRNSIYDGETWDMREYASDWKQNGFCSFPKAVTCEAPGGRMTPMLIHPVQEIQEIAPISIVPICDGEWLYDFGRNLTGTARIRLPKGKTGQKISIRFCEILHEDGTPDFHTLRLAEQRDVYIYSGSDTDIKIWQPLFTYHGFRYAVVEGFYLDGSNISAVAFSTEMESGSFFSCGSALVDRIQKMILDTEQNNQHSILSDCPQRDERMAWLNDATVRIEECACNFYALPMFRKLVRDVLDTQRKDGAIGCTAPFVFGEYPADPTCSAFIVAAEASYRYYGDLSLIREGYSGFKAWEQNLLKNSDDYIVNYSYYGDWAGPAYACVVGGIGDGAKSAVTPGTLISTAFSMYNCRLISSFADIIGNEKDRETYTRLAEKIKTAILKKWYNPEGDSFGTNSMSCITVALWLNLFDEEKSRKLAEKLNRDVIDSGLRFTNGNMTVRMMLEVLTRYGYCDTAWAIISNEEYPSWGFMIQNEATSVWERFEDKFSNEMNSRNHPMYGAVGSWFYTDIAGINAEAPGFEKIKISPHFPKKLLSVNAMMDTPMGNVSVRWLRKNGMVHLNVCIPFGTQAKVIVGRTDQIVGSGFYSFKCSEEEVTGSVL